jgi:hypothetical protein
MYIEEGKPVYIRDYQAKNHVYVSKNKARQGRRMKTQTWSE